MANDSIVILDSPWGDTPEGIYCRVRAAYLIDIREFISLRRYLPPFLTRRQIRALFYGMVSEFSLGELIYIHAHMVYAGHGLPWQTDS